MSNLSYTSSTEGQTKIINIQWRISRFLFLLQNKKTREIRAEQDPNADLSEPRFNLKIQFLGRDNDIIEFYYLPRSSVFLKSSFSIYSKRRDPQLIVTKDYQTMFANQWQYLTTMFKKDIISFEGQDKYIQKYGSFDLLFEFRAASDVIVNPFNISVGQLSTDFENLLIDGLFSDVTIKSTDGTMYKVHKNILASRCAVLKAHFNHNTTECYTNIVESPLDSDVLFEVLTFLYSDRASKIDEIPEKLLEAADYYQLDRLKSLCEEALHKKLSVENAIETLRLAELYSSNRLRLLTLQFIKDEGKSIINSEEWTKLESVELMKKICQYIMVDEIETEE